MKFKVNSNLNCKKNLKKAKKLVLKYNLNNNIPFEKEIAYFQKELGYSDPWAGGCSTIGHRQYLLLTENNYVKIIDHNCDRTRILVKIKLQILKSIL